MRATALTLLLASQQGAGWVTLPETQTDRKIMWPTPEDPLNDTGLGGGISYMVASDFCAKLLPRFIEDDEWHTSVIDFVSCADVNDAIARAMATWASNHPYVDFYNVTDECVAQGREADCPLAELFIDAKSPAPGDEPVAAFVLHNPLDLGRDYGAQRWEVGVRAPSGEVVPGDWQIKFATLTFHNHLCWYLDQTFCARFRALNEQLDALVLMQIIIWGLWAASFLVLFLRLTQAVFLVSRFGLKSGLKRALLAQSTSMLLTYALLFCLISPPIVWFKIFIPCLTCFDFEATAAHELGHVLGFTHTDTTPESNRVEQSRFSADTCLAERGVPDTEGANVVLDSAYAGIADSIMFHLTTKKSRTCLSQNDFQGLLYTYPVCDSLSIRQSAEPLCDVSQRNIGWVRFVAATLPPFVFASVAVFLLVYVALNLENKDQTRNRWKLAGNSARETAYTNRRDSRRAAAAPGRAEERA